ncbi:MAG: trypsin-like peptidase domain-containing protein [Clostridia bacterium]|nr:trypsin-like peptidase domain-containing protein [Clostridia bacterium]
MRKLAKITLIAVLSAITALATFGCISLNGGQENLADSIDSAKAVVFNSGSSDRQKMDKVDAIDKVRRSVVAIKMPMSDGTASYGSGVIVNMTREDVNEQNVFYILTCHHVVESKGNITVFVPDEEGDNWGESDYNYDYSFSGQIGGSFSRQVTLVGGDANSDIAVLRLDISGSGVTSDKIVKSDLAPATGYTMRVGEDVFAIGNPSGTLPGSVTVGTIGYINREVSISGIGEMTLVQLNTDIYHGSSGGALFNLYGEVIGITNSGSDTYIGIGYAVPYVIDAENGTSDNGFINIASQLLGTYNGENYGYISGRKEKFGFTAQVDTDSTDTVKVTSVTAGSQASDYMKEEDIIKSVQVSRATVGQDGEITYQDEALVNIKSLSTLTETIESLKILDKLTINLRRPYYNIYTNQTAILTARQFIFCDTGVYPSAS